MGLRVLFTIPFTIPNNPSILPGPLFAVGLCHGTSNILGDATTDHFVGVVSDGDWASEFSEYLYDFIVFKGAVKIGTSTTLSTPLNSAGLNGQFGQGTNAAWTPTPQNFFVDITKGSPNFTINTFYISNGQSVGIQSAALFLSDVVLATPAQTGQAFGASPASMAVNEATNGILDTVNVSWNRTDFWPEICDLAVVVLS